MTERKGRSMARPTFVVGLFLALAALPFVPLLLSIVEDASFGTSHVQRYCRRLGVHDELGRLYKAFGID